jgi:hypothetical protein
MDVLVFIHPLQMADFKGLLFERWDLFPTLGIGPGAHVNDSSLDRVRRRSTLTVP